MSQFNRNVWCETLTLGPAGSEIILGVDKSTGELTIATPFTAQPARKMPYRYDAVVDSVGNVGGGEDVLMSKSIPLNLIPVEGQQIQFRATFHVANSAGTKTTKTYIDTTEIASIVSAAGTLLSQLAEGAITRLSDTLVHVHIRMFDSDGTSGVLGTQWAEFHNEVTVTAGASFLLKFTGTAAGATNDDIIQDSLTLVVLP